MDGLIETLGQLARSVDEVTAAVHEGQDEASRERAQFAARLERGRRQLQEVAAEVGTTPTRYRRVELGGGSAEVRALVGAWVGR